MVDKTRTVTDSRTDYHKTTDQSTKYGPKYKTRTSGPNSGTDLTKHGPPRTTFRDKKIMLHMVVVDTNVSTTKVGSI